MKAAFYKGNRTFEIGENTPVKPGEGEVMLEVAYCGVCGTDVHIYHGVMDQRVGPPQVIGHEASGTVIETGPGVNNVKAGDHVAVRPLKFGDPHIFDKGHPHVGKNLKFIGIDLQGAFQKYWTVPAYTLHKLPDSLSLKHGALIEPLAVACHDVKIGRVTEGEICVVIGGGPIGLLIGYALKDKGAHIIVSEVNDTRLEMLGELGFATVNPMKEDLEARISQLTDEKMADVVFEVSGSAAGVESMTRIVNVRGRIVVVAIHGGEPKKVDLFKFFWSEIEMLGARLYEAEDYEEAIRIASSGLVPLDTLITRIGNLADIQKVFEEIDSDPEGMKYLVNCRN